MQPPSTSYNFAANTHNYPRAGIISLPPSTTFHNQPFFTATIHIHPRPTIIKSPLPTNNDSLPTNLLSITNSELYFCHHYSPAKFQEQSKFIRHYPSNTKEFSFPECGNSFYSQFTVSEDKNQEAMLSCEGKFLCRLIFSGYELLKISLNQLLRLKKNSYKFVYFQIYMNMCI